MLDFFIDQPVVIDSMGVTGMQTYSVEDVLDGYVCVGWHTLSAYAGMIGRGERDKCTPSDSIVGVCFSMTGL